MLFASTVINYIDRQTLSVLAPYLKVEFGWNNVEFSWIVVGFRVAYAIFQTVGGRVLDRIGTRTGLMLAVCWYSFASMLTAGAQGLRSFIVCRFLLGAGEAANWPGATKAVAEWFPAEERGWAVALFDSGSAIGGAIAPILVVWLYQTFGTWRPAFLIVGVLGFLWVLAWRAVYTEHPSAAATPAAEPAAPWQSLVGQRNTWGIILGKALTDPVWFFITDWFAILLVSKGYRMETMVLSFWIPFVAADAGNFFGGGVSSALIRRGWPVVKARKAVILVCGVGMAALIPAAFASSLAALVTLFAISTFSYAAWSTMCLTLPSDLYRNGEVATVSGMSGTGAGIGTIVSTLLIGKVADHYSFTPLLIAASVIPLVATVLVMGLVKENARTEDARASLKSR